MKLGYIETKELNSYYGRIYMYEINDLTKGLFAYFINELHIGVSGFAVSQRQEYLTGGIYLGSKICKLQDLKNRDILIITINTNLSKIEGKVKKFFLSEEEKEFLKKHSKISLPYKKGEQQRYYSSVSLLYALQRIQWQALHIVWG